MDYKKHLEKISENKQVMIDQLIEWVEINSFSENLEGLSNMLTVLKKAFSSLGAEVEEIEIPAQKIINEKGDLVETPLGKALSLKKRPNAPVQVFLGGHMDTVFPKSSSFQKVEWIDHKTLRGPGVVDMKGGLMILLKSLETFEQTPFVDGLGWHVLITPDEEIGSPGSETLIRKCAKESHIGFVFEPSYPDGSIVSARKGSINFTAVAKGKSAHAGRDFHKGVNAITALSQFILQAEALTDIDHGITVNVGKFSGGVALNIVPNLAICGINVRMIHPEDMPKIKEEMQRLAGRMHLFLHENSARPPKPFEEKHQMLFNSLRACAKELNMDIQWQSSGGVTDGNLLFDEGLPNIDSLGAVGGGMHTHEEYIDVDCLVDRIRLVSLLLMKLAANDGQ